MLTQWQTALLTATVKDGNGYSLPCASDMSGIRFEQKHLNPENNMAPSP